MEIGSLVMYTEPLREAHNTLANALYEERHGAVLGAFGLIVGKHKYREDAKYYVLFVPLLEPCLMFNYQISLVPM